MRKIFGLIFVCIALTGFSQTPEAADFKTTISKTEASIGDVIELTFTAPVVEHFHIYAMGGDCEFGPKRPWFDKEIFSATDCELLGKIRNGVTPKTTFDDIFNCNVAQFDKTAVLKQKVKITGNNPVLKAELWYQICSESMCLDMGYAFSMPKIKVTASKDKPTKDQDTQGTTTPDTTEEIDTVKSASLDSSSKSVVSNDTIVEKSTKPNENKNESDTKNKSLWGLFLLGVLGGLAAIFTPCVYPMIPMTVAFFTKETDKAKGKKKAIFYGISILGIYIILGVILAKVLGETFSYTLSTHWLPNILFFLIFIIFAMSFLGMFELTLPAGFVNKMDQKGDKGGYIGVFFIAFTLVLVSFSCTAPIVGTVALLATDGQIIRAIVAMSGFALVFALPFSLFAFFPQWLNNMPQSGGWLNSVKVVLGFLELALAFKFLSQADLAYHWGILDRDVFLSIWIVLSLLLGAYLLGKIKLPHDSDLNNIPVPRFFAGVAAIVFGIYMIPGLWGAPLKPLAGFIPPLSTQDFIATDGDGHQKAVNTHKYADIIKTATHLDINPYFDYNEALAAGKKAKKPIFVDFTGHTCANCRKMEEYVWPEDTVLNQLKNDFIVLSLYCDENYELPKSQWYKNKNGRTMKTIGQQNLDRGKTQFDAIGQPFYFVIDWEENVYGSFNGYDPDYIKYADFLSNGNKAFQEWLAKQ